MTNLIYGISYFLLQFKPDFVDFFKKTVGFLKCLCKSFSGRSTFYFAEVVG